MLRIENRTIEVDDKVNSNIIYCKLQFMNWSQYQLIMNISLQLIITQLIVFNISYRMICLH